MAPAQGSSFKCLPRLRELRIKAEVEPHPHMYDEAVISVDMWGLPAGLHTVEVRQATVVVLLCGDCDLKQAPLKAARATSLPPQGNSREGCSRS